jgi:hypothetical protein
MAASKESNASKGDLKIIQNDISYIRDDVKEIKVSMNQNLVTNDRFETVKGRVALLEKAVFGVIGLALVLILTAVFSGALK